MAIVKSSRHAKIAGDFGEALLLYWLSKDGFECAKVDHTSIDLIAHNRHTGERMGISVKSRTRMLGTETDGINIPNDQFVKVQEACKSFGLQPYFALVVDTSELIRVFVVSKEKLLNLYPPRTSTSIW